MNSVDNDPASMLVHNVSVHNDGQRAEGEDDMVTADSDRLQHHTGQTNNVHTVLDLEQATKGSDSAVEKRDTIPYHNSPESENTICEEPRSCVNVTDATAPVTGVWVPVPGHPTVSKWVPIKSSETLESPRKETRCSRCKKRCQACFHTALFRTCCVPLMVCLFCCGPPGWLLIYIISTEREQQKSRDAKL